MFDWLKVDFIRHMVVGPPRLQVPRHAGSWEVIHHQLFFHSFIAKVVCDTYSTKDSEIGENTLYN